MVNHEIGYSALLQPFGNRIIESLQFIGKTLIINRIYGRIRIQLVNRPISIIGHSAQFARRGPNVGIDAVSVLFLRVRMGATARNRLYTTMQVDYFSTVLDLGQHILLEIDPTDIEYQLRTIQIDHLPGCRLETFPGFIPGGTSTSTRKSSPTISETIPRKGRIDTKIVGRSSRVGTHSR